MGVEPGPPGWKPGILTARPYGKSLIADFYFAVNRSFSKSRPPYKLVNLGLQDESHFVFLLGIVFIRQISFNSVFVFSR